MRSLFGQVTLTRAVGLLVAIAGCSLLIWLASENLPKGVLATATWLYTILVTLLTFLYFKVRMNVFFGLMVFGIPLGITLSVIALVNMLQNMGSVGALSGHMSTALWFVLLGGFSSAVGYFGFNETEPTKQGKLGSADCILVITIICSAPIVLSDYLSVLFSDLVSIGVFGSVVAVGVGLAVFKGVRLKSALPNIFVSVAVLGAALSAIGWMIAALQSDVDNTGRVLALGILTMYYGANSYVASIIFALMGDNSMKSYGFTTKNWHLVEAYMFLVFMALGPPTIFEVWQG